MKETGYQFIAVLVLLNQWIPSILSQNLVPNPSFEVYDTCPDNWLQFGDPFPSIPWVQGNGASADYFNICAPWQTVGVPVNYFGEQDAVSGYAYGGFFGRAGPDDYREYIMAPLDTPLTAGVGYYVFLYVSPSDDRCAIKTIGALFTRDPPEYGVIDGPLMYFPQIEVNGEFLNDYDNWTRISGCFVAEGGERYITIGNFRNDNFTPVDPDCESINFPESAYYYLDSVSVVESPWSEGELDNLSVTACYSVEVSPGVLAENYLWSDGTTNPTIVVTESGTYYVTVSTECAFQTGAIEVTILQGSDPVTLPDDSIYLCAGETIEISLDPESGEYLWQDGTTGWNYTISTEGIYSVTLSDGCDLTSDQVYVEYLEAPEPFSLGTDTFLCPGSIIQYVFDPTLGQFTWQDGSDAPAYIADAPGLYSLTITNMCGQSQDEIFISGIFPPVFALGQSPTIFCDGDSILIELDPQLGTFEWHDGSTINTFVVSESGYVSVTVTNECYSLSDEIEVYVFETPQFALGQDTSLCPGQLPLSVDLSAVPFAESYLWSDGSTMAIHDIDTAGSHSVTISNDCFSFEDTIDVTVLDNAPDLVLPPDQLLCPGQTFVLDAGGLMGTYQWSTSTGSMTDADTFLVTEPGTYYLTVTNICGSGSDSININYVPPLAPPDLGADFSLCPGETGVLYAGVENVNYLWSEGTTGTIGTADSIVITSPGIYSVQISDACTSASDTIVITSNANPPDVDLPDVVDLCQGDSIVVEAGITGVQYLWEDGTQLSSVIVNSTGVYALTVSNACGSDTDSVLVNDAGSAPLVSLGDDIALCSGDTVMVIPQSMHVESWLWHDSTTASSIDISAAGIIHVQGVNQCGTAADTLIV
ncbi:MAG TPA: hypothetical protein VI603_05990, partial [Saprospiraceae bacterium]|nr:hypothetical protein [Saprospiraceae bacterium]